MDARQAFAEAVSNEVGLDLNDEVLARIDQMLMALWLLGFMIVELKEEETAREYVT